MFWGSQVALVVKNLPTNAGGIRGTGSIPGSGRSPGEENGNPLQYSCLENPVDRGAWQAAVHGVTKSWTQLKQLTLTHTHTHTHTQMVFRVKLLDFWLDTEVKVVVDYLWIIIQYDFGNACSKFLSRYRYRFRTLSLKLVLDWLSVDRHKSLLSVNNLSKQTITKQREKKKLYGTK